MSVPAEDLSSDPIALTLLADSFSKDVTDLLKAENFPAAIDKATTGIEFLEKGMANNPPELQERFGPSLFSLYADRAMAYSNSGVEAQALQDIETALAMPAAYQNAQMTGLLQNLKAPAEAQSEPAGLPQTQPSREISWWAVAVLGLGAVYMLYGFLFDQAGTVVLLMGIAFAAAALIYVRLNTR